MKKIVLAVSVFLIVACVVFSNVARAGEILHPPKDLKSLVGKTITFTSGPGYTWYARVEGVSENIHSQGRAIIIYLPPGVTFSGFPVKNIVYYSNFATDWWQVEFFETEVQKGENGRITTNLIERNATIQVLSFN